MKSLFILLLILSATVFPQKLVYVGDIENEIDLGLVPYVKRILSEAEKNNAAAIIFKINTFGGRVDAATQIKDAIIASKVPVIGFVNNRAISAGALITLSCEKIIMAPGSNIGAATVVDQQGQKLSEKYQSYMRGEMRSTAERRGRRVDIAEAMVDERIVVSDIQDDSTKLVSLTSEEALKVNVTDTVLSNLSEVLSFLNLENAVLKSEDSNWAEDFVRFLNNPIVSSILIMIGFLGLMAEIKTPGWGAAGTVSLIALTLFFGSSYILQLASVLEIALFVIGVILLAIEVFVIPGFGFSGIIGALLVIASIFLALIGSIPVWDISLFSTAIIQMAFALIASIILIFILAKYLPKSNTFNKLVLSSEINAKQGFVTFHDQHDLVNAEGVALTTLRPTGIALIDGNRIDVLSEGGYIEKDSKIKVIRVEGVKVVVKEVV